MSLPATGRAPARAATLRVALGGGLLAALAATVVVLRLRPGLAAPLRAALDDAQGWAHGSWPQFVALQVLIALSGVVPASLVGLAAGAAYGPVLGFAVAAASTLAAAAIAFALARSALRPAIAAMLSRRAALSRMDRAITRDGWRTVCLLRVSPVMPFALTSYALGLTGLRTSHYILGTLAALPALAGYVVLGWLGRVGARHAADGLSAFQAIGLGIGAIATIGMIVHVGRLLRRAVLTEHECD